MTQKYVGLFFVILLINFSAHDVNAMKTEVSPEQKESDYRATLTNQLRKVKGNIKKEGGAQQKTGKPLPGATSTSQWPTF